jgi:arylsulfatase A-like enzyme
MKDSISESRSSSPGVAGRLGPVDVLALAAFCGLAGGELEVAARVGSRALSSTNRLYLMTRHFVWLVPTINLALFLGLGTLLALASRRWPRRAGWWSPRLIVAWALLPALGLAGRGIYIEAWLLVAAGIAARVVPALERRPDRWRPRLVRSLPALLGLVLLQAGGILGMDQIRRWRAEGRPEPPAGSPNVLLIVLDTVRADHLSLYGYPRPTTPNLERLARRGVRFDHARAAAPWTLASHATMFTGCWPHELGIAWSSPLPAGVPTLAEHLGSLGYATAGFAGNTIYCAYDSGLDRGFTDYRDHVVDGLSAARTARSVNEALKAAAWLGRFFPIPGATLLKLSEGERKHAEVVNREFLDWLSRRRGPQRPFFAFLNYMDAHAPYLLPPAASTGLGPLPMTDADVRFLADGWMRADKRHLPPEARLLAIDAYDHCLAYLDARLGELVDELERRGVLDRTLVIITADHGEGLGEHGLFDHGESLYRTEIRVPLLILPPAGQDRSPAAVGEFVSLRDLPATVVDLIGVGDGSPFPGRSLAQSWADRPAGAPPSEADVARSELDSPNPSDPNRGRSPARRGPLVALAEGDFVYIRNAGDGREELFSRRDDPHELHDLAGAEAMLPVLRRFRNRLRPTEAPAAAAAARPGTRGPRGGAGSGALAWDPAGIVRQIPIEHP